jgi:hypothetical protein
MFLLYYFIFFLVLLCPLCVPGKVEDFFL